MNAVTEVMDELRKALSELEDCRARNADLRTMLEQVTRERDEARAACPDCAMWAERSARWHDDMQRAERERDEARATIAQIRRVFGNAIAFDDARGDIVKMAEIAYRGACDGDKAVGALRGMTRQRDEARAEVERLRGILPELPPRAPDGHGLPRYGLRWNGPSDPASVPMADGYWTPWHLASGAYRRGAEAMREACAEACWSVPPDAHPSDCAFAVNALPIPEEP